ncbi:MAG TPA: nuclear transport factor 2 family protein [Longimicrobiales bacterium]|nr:nuclear transport factor 2 family protein [Longimicrobiales bacterium]
MKSRIGLACAGLVFLACSAPAAVSAQEPPSGDEDRAAILATAETFFASMTARDMEAARSVLDPRGRFFSVRSAPDGTRSVRTFTNQEYLDGLMGGTTVQLERMWDPQVRVHGDIATIWASYDFHQDGAFSHCGVDAFDLIRTPDGWKITGGVYTVERDGCPPSPLGPVGSR